MNKKLTSLLACGLILSALASCASETPAAPTGTTTNNNGGGASSSASSSAPSATQTTPNVTFEQGILLTTAGQSADYQMIGTVLEKLEMEVNTNNLATSADLGDAQTLVIVIGGSSKGLGAAGVDANGELDRLDELMAAAKEAGVNVLAMHTGGATRRGDLSDAFIAPIFDNADHAVVVVTGDEDGLMQGLCADGGVSISLIDTIAEVTTLLPDLFA